MTLPEYAKPPVVEMALGIQCQPVPALRGLALAPLRELWRERYPRLEEQPFLPPAMESPASANPVTLRLGFGPIPGARYWFMTEDATEFVQVQTDRLIVNWRNLGAPHEGATYPRYDRHMRPVFEQRYRDVNGFLEGLGLGPLVATQVEVNYINAIDVAEDETGHANRIFSGWQWPDAHHLGKPAESHLLMAFDVPDMGITPSRLYLEIHPAERSNGTKVIFATFTARGAPSGTGLPEVLQFMDQARGHIVRSFTELTPPPMHEQWERLA